MSIVAVETPLRTVVSISATYTNLDGSYPTGYVSFTPVQALFDRIAHTVTVPVPVRIPLVSGAFTTTLQTTNVGNGTPTLFTYRVQESFVGGRTFYMTVPYSSPAINLGQVIPFRTPGQAAHLYPSLDVFYDLLAQIAALEAQISGNTVTGAFAPADIFPPIDSFI